MKRKAAKHLADASRELKAASGTPASAPLLISEEKVNNTESLPQEESAAPEPLQLLPDVLMISVRPAAIKEEAAEKAAAAGAASADATLSPAKPTSLGKMVSAEETLEFLFALEVKEEIALDDGLRKKPSLPAVSSAAPTLAPPPPLRSVSPTASFALQVEAALQKLHDAKVHLAIKNLDAAQLALAVAKLAVAKKKLLEVLHGTPLKQLRMLGSDVWLPGLNWRKTKSALVTQLSQIPSQEIVIGAEYRGKSSVELRKAVKARNMKTRGDGFRKLRGRELIIRLADPTNKIYASKNTSQFRGVQKLDRSHRKHSKKRNNWGWTANITVGGSNKYLGSFSDEEKAARAFDKYVVDNNLDRPLNFPVAAEDEDDESSSNDEKEEAFADSDDVDEEHGVAAAAVPAAKRQRTSTHSSHTVVPSDNDDMEPSSSDDSVLVSDEEIQLLLNLTANAAGSSSATASSSAAPSVAPPAKRRKKSARTSQSVARSSSVAAAASSSSSSSAASAFAPPCTCAHKDVGSLHFVYRFSWSCARCRSSPTDSPCYTCLVCNRCYYCSECRAALYVKYGSSKSY